ITILRCFVRVYVERRTLTLPDWLVWFGWFSTLGFCIGSSVALNIQKAHPLVEPELVTNSVAYLKTVFIMCYFFDFGIYSPKASLVAFFWWLIPLGFRRLRIAVYVSAAYVGCCFLGTLLTDTLIAPTISDNWSLDNQMNSTWNSYTAFASNWALNWSTDLLLFIFPFFILNCLKLHRRQKIALCGVFSLGLITMTISLARFIVYTVTDYNVDDATGNLLCTAEMCTAVVVVSLPALKPLLIRNSPNNSSYPRSTNGYMQHPGSGKPLSNHGTSRSQVHGGRISDDELELVFQGARIDSRSQSHTTTSTDPPNPKDIVLVTTEYNVTTHAI
ncbi:archaeal flagellin n-terminal-like domain-containing protein, partial [Stagonosporopsis vannaccii]